MGCFSGSCFRPYSGELAERSGYGGLQPSAQIRGLKQAVGGECIATSAAEQRPWSGHSVSSGQDQSSSSCQASAEVSDSGSVNQHQTKAYVQAVSRKHQCKQLLTTATAQVLYPYIIQHGGGILGLSTLQEGLQHFVVPGMGYIAYAMMRNGPDFLNVLSPVALGDPICHPSQFQGIAKAFLQQHPKAMFMQVSESFARVLLSLGLLVNSVGGETHVDLATYTFSGYAKRGLRSAIASAAKEGIAVEEVMQAPVAAQDVAAGAAAPAAATDWAALAAEMRQVDREWLLRKGKHAGRVWFLNRQPVYAPEPGVRKLTARDRSGRLLGFIFFDAVYEGGALAGYYANVTRMRPDAHPGVLNLLVKDFMDRVRAESQLSAPAKKLSMKKSLKKKLEQQQQQQQQALNTSVAVAPASTATATGGGSSSSSSVRFLSLGLSPLHQMDDSQFPHSSTVRRLFELTHNHGSGYYPFKPLAAAKAKYGAGLHDGKYLDPAVIYQQRYLAHPHTNRAAAAVAIFDLAKLVGFWKNPADAVAAVLSQNIRKKVQDAKRQMAQRKQQQSIRSATSSKAAAGTAAPAAAIGAATASSTGARQGTVNAPHTAAAPAAAAAAAHEDSSVASEASAEGPMQSKLLLHSATSISDTSSLIGTAANGSPCGVNCSSSGGSSESCSQC